MGSLTLQDIQTLLDTAMENLSKVLMQKFKENLDAKLQPIVQKLGEVTTSVAQLTTRTDQMEQRVVKVDTNVSALQDKVIELEDRGRRNNLRFVGLPSPKFDKDVDKYEVTKRTVIDFCKRHRLFDNPEDLVIQRAHPLPSTNKKEVVIAAFAFWGQKNAILKNARKLKGTPYSIQEDFCHDTVV